MEIRKQLELSVHELEAIGFTGHYLPECALGPSRVYYSIPVTNAEFIYNVDNAPYKWYLKTTIGDASNSIWLNIGKVAELYMVLSCFQATYNLVIDI